MYTYVRHFCITSPLFHYQLYNKLDKLWLVHKSCLSLSLSLWRPPQYCKYRHSSLCTPVYVCDSEKQHVAADKLLSAIKLSDYIQLFSVCEWMYGCMWMWGPHTMQGRWEWLIHSQHRNDGECVQRAGQQVGLFHIVWAVDTQRDGQRKLKKRKKSNKRKTRAGLYSSQWKESCGAMWSVTPITFPINNYYSQ